MIVTSRAFSLQITEVFYKGNAYIRSEERFIEIYNEGTNAFDLSVLTVSVPKSDTETVDIGVETGKFLIRQDDVVTNSLVLPSGGYAVVLTEDYNRFAKLLPFASNCLLLKPKLKTFSGWSWAERLGLIALKSNGVILFSCGNFPTPTDKNIREGESVSLNGGCFTVTRLSPGINNNCAFYSENSFIRGNASVVIRFSGPDSTNAILNAEVRVNNGPISSVVFNRVSPGLWETFYSPCGLEHGDDIRFRTGGNAFLMRYLETRPLSSNYHSALINEIVTDPQTDYSGGGWTGNDGGGKIDDTDEWMEIVNTSDREIGLSNFYILYRSKTSESVKGLSFRTNAGFGKKSNVLSNYNYIVVSAEGGLADNAVIGLYEGYPYLNGKMVDEVEYGGDEWNSAPSGKSSGKDDEAIVRIPNAVFDGNLRDVFRKLTASYARVNENTPAMLWSRDVIGTLSNTIYMIDSDNTNSVQEVFVRNSCDSEKVTLTNRGIYFYGTAIMKNENGAEGDGFLNVKNGMQNTVSFYHADTCMTITSRFTWAKEGWSLPSVSPDVKNAIVYPNPVSEGRKNILVFANLPEGAEVSVIDPYGNIIKKLINPENGLLTWETELKKGIYIAVIRSGSSAASRKLLVR